MVTSEDWARDKVAFGLAEPPSDAVGGGPLAAQFAVLTRRLLDASSVAEVLDHVVRAAYHVVPGADLVSITLRSADGTFHTPAETEPVASELDQLQYTTGEGPCVAAALPTGPAHMRCDNLALEPVWPRFGPAAAAHGVHAVLAVALLPYATPPRYSGALNIYSRVPGALGADAHEAALLLATHASLALADTMAVTQAELLAVQLRAAVDSRDVIGQAKGILMNRRGITADEAFDQLRRVSQDLNVKLADLAQVLATRHTELDLSDLDRRR
ncbi:ANTAR domain-containing protein [Actinophytocola sp.]|jgi:hypothetical protein|uniref:ANTAR domain-containing protein n=1 Tax=Actinophytocola sp. TaxID=1872138 RepID=UPI002ED814FA